MVAQPNINLTDESSDTRHIPGYPASVSIPSGSQDKTDSHHQSQKPLYGYDLAVLCDAGNAEPVCALSLAYLY